jgi:hypothetical protein
VAKNLLLQTPHHLLIFLLLQVVLLVVRLAVVAVLVDFVLPQELLGEVGQPNLLYL